MLNKFVKEKIFLKTIIQALVLAGSANLSFVAIAAHELRNGTDNYKPEHMSAWFLGEDDVHYCIETSQKFSAYKELPSLVVKAIASWNEMARNNVNLDTDFERPLHIKAKYLQDEKCTSETDLTLYFGVENERIKKPKLQFQNPTAGIFQSK